MRMGVLSLAASAREQKRQLRQIVGGERDANKIVSQELRCTMTDIRLTKLYHFSILKCARIAATSAVDVDTREEGFFILIPFTIGI
jgi:hypothetical protein